MTVLVFGPADLPLIHYLSGMRGTPKRIENNAFYSPLSLFFLFLQEELELEPKPEMTFLSPILSQTWW